MNRPVVWVDVSAALDHRHPRIQGVARFVLETAEELASRPEVRFFRFDSRYHRFVSVTVAELEAKRSRLTSNARPSTAPKILTRCKILLSDLSTSPSKLHRALPTSLKNVRATLHTVRLTSFRFWTALRNLPTRLTGRESRHPACMSATWVNGDVIVHLGFWDWASNLQAHEIVARRAEQAKIHIVRFIHDLVPAIRPHFTGNPRPQSDALREILQRTEIVLANSQHTKSDVEHFCATVGIQSPAAHVVRMASRVGTEPPVRPVEIDEGSPFVLCVGTIEIRKNHHLLFDVWETFFTEMSPDEIPLLVLAGSMGWSNAETVQRLRFTPGFDTVMRFVEAPSDAELAWLYQNCSFTVYPSLYEGWGYPITESLDAGKVVVTSNVSSMPEAAQGLGILLDPQDRQAWRDTIVRLSRTPDLLHTMEDRIRAEYTWVTPAETANDVWMAVTSHQTRA